MSFETLSQRVIDGGTLTDADVNEWRVRAPWYRRVLTWLREVLRG